jgi:hypothetical protein
LADKLADLMDDYAADPVGFVRDAFAWGEGPLQHHAGPRAWQADILGIIGAHLSNPDTRCTSAWPRGTASASPRWSG